MLSVRLVLSQRRYSELNQNDQCPLSIPDGLFCKQFAGINPETHKALNLQSLLEEMNYKEDIKAMCLHSFCIRKTEGVHFNPPSPLSSSVLMLVKSLSHQVRQITFQRLLSAAEQGSRAAQEAAGSQGGQQVPNTCGALQISIPGTSRQWQSMTG